MGLIQTPKLVLISILIYFAACALLFPARYKSISKKRVFAGILFIFLFSVFAYYDTDYFHYLDEFKSLLRGFDTSLEEVYYFIARISHQNYDLFRIIIWGTAFLLYLITVKHYGLPLDRTLCLFTGICLTIFAYARVSLAMSIIFLSLSLITVRKTRFQILSVLLGIILLIGSFYFHKSAFFGIVIVILACLFRNLNRGKIILGIMSLPIILTGLTIVLSNLSFGLMDYGEDMEQSIDTAQYYLSSDADSVGIGRMVLNFLRYSPFYLSLIIYVRNVWNKKIELWDTSIRILGCTLFFIVVLSSLLLFDIGFNTSIMFYRFLYFAIIPMSLFLSYCWGKNVDTKLVKLAFYIGWTGILYQLSYSLYVTMV